MKEDDVDLESRNAIGGLDRLVTNISLAIVSVFPTFGVAILQPWKLVPQLASNPPDGRSGYLLSPGAYFPICLTVMLLIAALFATEETLASNGGAIGPGMAIAVAEAASSGNLWRTISILAPLYFIAVIAGVAAQIIRPFAGSWWTMRVSLRAALYQMTTSIGGIILSSAVIDLISVSNPGTGIGGQLYAMNEFIIFGMAWWIYFCFLKWSGKLSTLRALILSACILGFVALIVIASNWALAAV